MLLIKSTQEKKEQIATEHFYIRILNYYEGFNWY